MEFKHWNLNIESHNQHNIIYLHFNHQNASVNTFNKETLEELSILLDQVKQMVNASPYAGIIIQSRKKDSFCAGANIEEFLNIHTKHDALEALKTGQRIFQKLVTLTIPSVVIISGFCLGGGLEFALSCTYRIAEDIPKTYLGLPEVKLGIYPGWGGTMRLARLIGDVAALQLILSGRLIHAKLAAKLGIIDILTPKRHLIDAARYYLLNKPSAHRPSWLNRFFNHQIIRVCLTYFFHKQCRKKINPDHYPAPFAILNHWKKVKHHDERALTEEMEENSWLFCSKTAKNLTRVFLLQEQLKKLEQDKTFTPKQVHVIGAGTMGGDIAAWCALEGLLVTLQDIDAKYIAKAIHRAAQLFKEKLKENHLIQQAMDRLTPDLLGDGIKTADIIIEAVIESIEAKQNVLKHVEKHAKPYAILATNTSSILLHEINTVLKQPERLIGIHFFNPVSKMKLVEIVHTEHTSTELIAKVTRFIKIINHLPLPVHNRPGFLINRILMPYLLESIKLFQEGASIDTIDDAMIKFGMPMGPITLADTVGLDICLSVANYLSQHFIMTPPQELITLVAQKKLGKKTGEGFYCYDKKGKKIDSFSSQSSHHATHSKENISSRLINVMLKEATRCLEEKIVTSADLLDAGMIFGIGFPPFRGGLIHNHLNLA